LQPSQVSIALELPYQQPSPRGGTT
jgi:hypothetical protein